MNSLATAGVETERPNASSWLIMNAASPRTNAPYASRAASARAASLQSSSFFSDAVDGWVLDSSPGSSSPIHGDDDFVSEIAAIEPAVDQSLLQQQSMIVAMSAGWDGYGAPSINRDLIRAMFSELRDALANAKCVVAPDVVPGGDNSLQAEWHLPNLELTYHLSSLGYRHTWVRDRSTDVEHEYFDRDAQDAFLKWLPALA